MEDIDKIRAYEELEGSTVIAKPLPQIPSFAVGVNELGSDSFAQLHKGERVVPANMNIPALSNEALMASAIRGLAIPGRGSTNTVTNNSQSENINNNVNNTFNVPEGSVGAQEIFDYARRTGSQMYRR